MRRIFALLFFVLFGSLSASGQSKPNWGRDYVYGPGGQVTVTAEPDTYPPSAPDNLSGYYDPSVCIVYLSWSASTDIGSGVYTYTIYRNNRAISFSLTTSGSDSNVAQNVTYNYYVTAQDHAGNNSAASSTIQVTTTGSSCGLLRVPPPGSAAALLIQAPTNEPPLLRYLHWLVRTRQFSFIRLPKTMTGGGL